MNEITKYEIWTEEYELKYIEPESLKPGEAHEITCDRQGYSWPTLVASFENEQEARAEFETMTASWAQTWCCTGKLFLVTEAWLSCAEYEGEDILQELWREYAPYRDKNS